MSQPDIPIFPPADLLMASSMSVQQHTGRSLESRLQAAVAVAAGGRKNSTMPALPTGALLAAMGGECQDGPTLTARLASAAAAAGNRDALVGESSVAATAGISQIGLKRLLGTARRVRCQPKRAFGV